MTTIYDVLRRPIITEKSNYQSAALNQYVFEVDKRATKAMVVPRHLSRTDLVKMLYIIMPLFPPHGSN